jgi:hypothetical protein
MAIVAYKQPVSKSELEEIRGVSCDYAIQKLLEKELVIINIRSEGPGAGKRMVVKGCSDQPVPPSAYLEITRRLQPIAQSIMFGEPCSTVPVYKKAKITSISE